MGKAKAPRPGVSRRNEATTDGQKVITITITRPIRTGKNHRPVPESHTLAPQLLEMRERIICRKATGLPFATFWSEDRLDIDSLAVLWWLARRKHGEVNLTWAQAIEDWPDDLDPDEIDVEFDDGEDDESNTDDEEGLDDPEG